MASTLATANQGCPLVVVIDELDRCRPSYAVELLEVAKHLFRVDHVVFVLTVNRSELAHSIRSLYGNDFDGDGYLRRFFDIAFQLPAPNDREKFVTSLLNAIRIDQYFERTQDQQGQAEADNARKLLQVFFAKSDLSLRKIEQAIHRLGLVLASLRSDRQSFAIVVVVALILRTINSDLFFQFIRGEVSDQDVADELFNRPWAKELRQAYVGQLAEAVIIAGSDDLNIESKLLEKYNALIEQGNDGDATPNQEDQRHAHEVINIARHFLESYVRHGRGIGFTQSVLRLDLLSPDLMDEETQGT